GEGEDRDADAVRRIGRGAVHRDDPEEEDEAALEGRLLERSGPADAQQAAQPRRRERAALPRAEREIAAGVECERERGGRGEGDAARERRAADAERGEA